MKLIPGDFQKLQISLLACLSMIAVGAAAAYLAYQSTQIATRARSTAQAQRNDMTIRLQRVRSEEVEIKEKSALFQRLQNRGVIGDEQRLEWVELLKDIREKRRLLELHYEIEPQRPLDATQGKDFRFNASTMKVQLRLLHEEDLIRFLADIRQQAKALIHTKSCSVSRQPPIASGTPNQANLQAECRIDWITLREMAAREGGK